MTLAFQRIATRLFAMGIVIALTIVGFPASPASAQDEESYAQKRRTLVDIVERRSLWDWGPDLPRRMSLEVAGALGAVKRHLYVPTDQRINAYQDRPLPIGYGQTISQPSLVALMTELADVSPGDRVLEIGTGSGYQAAMLAELGADVHTIEIIPALSKISVGVLTNEGYTNVTARVGDGYHGWPKAAPFKAIVVTAAASHIPPPLTEQLATGGRMVIPVGPPFLVQQLLLVSKFEDGTVTTRQLLPVQFVPLVRAD